MARTDTPGRIRGTQDIFGEEQRRFAAVLATFERVRALYCFNRVDIPVFESTAVFARSLGETTDVVAKEMYTFDDRSGDSITLRPEFTAGIARAFLTNGWQQHTPMKLATSGPVFRYERPQKGAVSSVSSDRCGDHRRARTGGGRRIARARRSVACTNWASPTV